MIKGSVKVVFLRAFRAYPDGFTERLYKEGEECDVPKSLAENWFEAKICRLASSTSIKAKPLPLDARVTKPKRTRKKVEK